MNILFLFFTHAFAVAGTVLYATFHGMTFEALAILTVALPVYGLSVTGGYHRLFAHASYEAHWLLRAYYLFFGAGCFENSALKWAEDHRRHHAKVDTEEDPYAITRGFWWAHMGWIFYQDPPANGRNAVGDLSRDRMVRMQHRFYVPIAILSGFGLPLAVGFLLGDPWGGLILGGFVRLVTIHHTTFCVNSLAHTIGVQTYSDRDSSRDSGLTALVTMGEGYHNYHHTFPFDYRNGARAYHFDPTKWAIRAFAWIGLAGRLVRAPAPLVLKARMEMIAKRAGPSIQRRPEAAEVLEGIRARVETLLNRWAELHERFVEMRNDLDRPARSTLSKKLRVTRARAREAFRSWRLALSRLQTAAV